MPSFSIAGKRQGFADTEELSSLKLLASPLFSDLGFYSLKMSKDCSTTKEGLRSRRFSERWMNLGMMWNGRVLTLKPMYHKIESEYSLLTFSSRTYPTNISSHQRRQASYSSEERNNCCRKITRKIPTKQSRFLNG